VVGERETDTDARAAAEQTKTVSNIHASFKMHFICDPP
jgi:hypothetical protein